jgi:hypothetical protein
MFATLEKLREKVSLVATVSQTIQEEDRSRARGPAAQG